MTAKIYPIFIKFTVPAKETYKFEERLNKLSSENGIKEDIIYFTHYTQEKLEEVEYFIKIDIPTGNQKLSEQQLIFTSNIFNSPLKSYYPTYSEEPNLRK